MIEPRERLTVIINETLEIVLDHFPQYDWAETRKKSIHLFGHLHDKENPVACTYSYNVGVERNNYRPISHSQFFIIN